MLIHYQHLSIKLLSNIKLIACTMSMDVMGIQKEELRDEVEYGGVGTYIGATENANHNLFI